MLMTQDKVKDFLPHRKPFLFIDNIVSIETQVEAPAEPKDLVGTVIIAEFLVREDLEILKGHFPGNPILPGVVQAEMMAQACAFSSYPLLKDSADKYDVETLLLGVEGAKFRKPVVPGMKLIIKTTLAKVRAHIASYDCEITCEGEKVSQASVLAKLVIKRKENES